MSQTLFLKSNLLHLRTNEGEFEVSNPEILFRGKPVPENLKIAVPIMDGAEWPGGVELIKQYKRREAYSLAGWSDEPTARDTIGTVFARLLPKEEKKHEWTTDEIMSMVEKKPAQPTPNFPKGGTTFTESAYKDPFNQALREVPQDIKDQVEFEHNTINEAWELWGNIAKNDNVNPQAFVFGYVEAKKKYAVSAPSESQEEVNVVLSDLTAFQNTLHESGFVTFRNLRGDIISVKGMIQHITKLLTRNP